jgi:Fe-S-cluster containining protein
MACTKRTEDAASLCVGCGFCCDGTLHGHTDVTADDESAVLAAGLSVVNAGGKMVFLQPCPSFSCGECLIYARRPGVCRGYRCKLRKNVDEGQMSVAEAREKIGVVKGLVAGINRLGAEANTPAKRQTLWRQLKDRLDEFEGEERDLRAKVILDLAALDFYLDRWFRRNKSKE